MDGLGNEMIKDIILTGDMFGAVPLDSISFGA